MNTTYGTWALSLAILLLGACNHSNDPSDSRRDAAGIWLGGFTSNTLGPTGGETGIIAEDGRAVFFDGPVYYTGSLSHGRLFSGVLTAYSQTALRFQDTGTLAAAGEVISGVQMAGSYKGVGDQGQFTFRYSAPLYERDASLAKVSANWEFVEGNNTLTFSIDANGVISGADSFNCIYNGKITVIDSRYNAYEVAFTLSSCATLDGDYEGLAFLSDQFAVDDVLVVSGANGRFARTYRFRRT